MPWTQKDQNASARKYYHANREKVKAKVNECGRRLAKRNRDYIEAYLLAHPCVDCGETDPVVLEFDHVRGAKKREVTAMGWRRCAIKTIQAEIDKCEVRCANCHKRATHIRRKQK